jgi:hypothetical protein
MPQCLVRLDVQWLKSGLLFQRQYAEKRHGAGKQRRREGRRSPLVSALRSWSSFSSLRPRAPWRPGDKDIATRAAERLLAGPPAEQGEPSRTANEGASKGPTNWHKWHTPIADDLVATGNAQAAPQATAPQQVGAFPAEANISG